MSNLLQVRAQDGGSSGVAITSITPVIGTTLVSVLGAFSADPGGTNRFYTSSGDAVYVKSNQAFGTADYDTICKGLKLLPGTTAYAQINARQVDASNAYLLSIGATSQTLYKFVAATLTSIATSAHDFTDGVAHDFGVRCSGTSISIITDGSVLSTATGQTDFAAAGYAQWQSYFPSSDASSSNGFQFTEVIVSDLGVSFSVTTQPTNTVTGATITSVVVTSTDTADSSTVVTATLVGGSTLGGTTTTTMASGVATFSALTATGVNTAQHLHFAATGYTAINSTNFNVTSGATNALPFEAAIMDTIATKNTTSNIREVLLFDKTTNLPYTGAAYNTSGLTCYVAKGSAAASAITLVTMTIGTFASADDTHAGFVEKNATYCKGAYQFSVPNGNIDTKGEVFYHFEHTDFYGVLRVIVSESDALAASLSARDIALATALKVWLADGGSSEHIGSNYVFKDTDGTTTLATVPIVPETVAQLPPKKQGPV